VRFAGRSAFNVKVSNQRRSDAGASTFGQQGDIGKPNLLLHPHHHHTPHHFTVDQHYAVVGLRKSGPEVGLLRVEL
jgi:hypothetical protein